ncbi:cobyrinate a,c-diamide synthase [Desulforamulus hydrothermalis]|uniref:Cobyrinate a,c-diamide synthase n=1 Tax=Desulforamulus hydrothermalis Lam5 = DSM 18033 TaxID=1121428 RepID=K8DYN6_9FIRM|nr:cobyrinate a,c-diamide synthase [Desulforamulus hydrothermalis]CCO07984.1 Cobyrinic acid A,C-diamide synthase [Desulforamulus hydrothermalis Lam5 = DSM 18033]SHG84800.1 hydrogenobyrinic acid a,c-diamide synthase (glutamine-hydrolysing) /cobyrinate a,c-diamide synthase [Desulforamulus hydrothermalis Lam5 = DSM 18033]
MQIPRIVIAGTHSGVGKTTLTLGLLAALKRRGCRVQPFKVGPDYIDPGLHTAAAGQTSHNLDSWMGSPAAVRQLLLRQSRAADLAVVEGVMGLFDGARGQGEAGSTAQVAKIIKAPVVLVFSAKGLGRSAAALVKGYRTFDPAVTIGGVIANGVSSERHRQYMREIMQELGIPLLGATDNRQSLTMPQRHLGLLPATENNDLPKMLQQLADIIEEQVDLAALWRLARQAPDLTGEEAVPPKPTFAGVQLAVARDEAFNFYYQDSLDFLSELGAKLLFFSPLHDATLPRDIHGIYIGGGFPEQFLPQLSANRAMKEQIRRAARRGMPLYAECGGLMYLCRGISTVAGERYEGVGLVPAEAKMQNRLAALGYVTATLNSPSLLGEPGRQLKGHEFHWSALEALPAERAAYRLSGGRGPAGRCEGYARDNLLASYVHLHFRYNPAAANHLLAACAKYKQRERGAP